MAGWYTVPTARRGAQAAGYLFQMERGLRHLAFSGTGALVGIETLDDIVVENASGVVVLEQDKHTTSGANPISDRSKGLWKSLNIWTEGIATGDIDPDKAEFHLSYKPRSLRRGRPHTKNLF